MTAQGVERPAGDDVEQQLARHESRVSDLTSRERLRGYARFYPAIAGLALLLSFLSLYEVRSSGEPTFEQWPSVWRELGGPFGGIAAFGLALMLGLLAFAVAATLRPESVGAPIGVAVLAALLVLVLLAKPGFRPGEARLSEMGEAGIGIAFGALVLSVAHAVHAGVARRRGGRALGP
jgi:hypothetical protein